MSSTGDGVRPLIQQRRETNMSTAYDSPYSNIAAVNVTSDASCALLKHIRVQSVTLNGVAGTGFYGWQASGSDVIDGVRCFRPTGATSGYFKLEGHAPSAAGVISLAQFNPVGDGEADDRAAVNAAIAVVNAVGARKELYMPAPSVRYRVSTGVSVLKSNVHI